MLGILVGEREQLLRVDVDGGEQAEDDAAGARAGGRCTGDHRIGKTVRAEAGQNNQLPMWEDGLAGGGSSR